MPATILAEIVKLVHHAAAVHSLQQFKMAWNKIQKCGAISRIELVDLCINMISSYYYIYIAYI